MPKAEKSRLASSVLEAVPMAVESGGALEQVPHARTDTSGASVAPEKPRFSPLTAYELNGKKIEFRRVPVPQHRMTPLKHSWLELYQPITQHLKLDMRMNLKTRKVEIKSTPETPDIGSLQKAADFINAFILGFEVRDAVALLRLDDLYIECFEVKDVKQSLRGEHLSRCIGRMAGKSGKTKFTIENATRTRVVIADTRIHILGSYQNIRVCRSDCSPLSSICSASSAALPMVCRTPLSKLGIPGAGTLSAASSWGHRLGKSTANSDPCAPG